MNKVEKSCLSCSNWVPLRDNHGICRNKEVRAVTKGYRLSSALAVVTLNLKVNDKLWLTPSYAVCEHYTTITRECI